MIASGSGDVVEVVVEGETGDESEVVVLVDGIVDVAAGVMVVVDASGGAVLGATTSSIVPSGAR